MTRRGDNIRRRKGSRQAARKKRDQMICIQPAPNRTAHPLTFQTVLAAWQNANQIRLCGASVSRYQNIIDSHILPVLGNIKTDKLDASVINQFLTEKLKNGRLDHTGSLSPSYVRSMALIISSAIAYGAANGLCPPLQSVIEKPSPAKKEVTVLDPAEQIILEKELLKNTNETKLLVYLTLYTGIRIGEACALRWEDIDLENRLLYVRQTVSRVWFVTDGKKHSQLVTGAPKSSASRRCIPICSRLFEFFCHFPCNKKQGYILTNATASSFVSPRTFEYRYKAILKKCLLPPYNYHALRHTFATRCIERGVDTKSLSEILGHCDISITLGIYVHSSIELKRLQLEKLTS